MVLPVHRPPLNYEEAAEYLNLSVRRLRKAVADNEIPYIQAGERMVRFLPDALDAWLLAQSRNLEQVREVVARTRGEQGLPATVTDPIIVGGIADLMRSTSADQAPDAA